MTSTAAKHIRSASGGFSFIELIVVVAITAMITGIMLANMKQNEQTRNIKIASDSISSALRQMQNNVLSGLPHSVSGNPARDWGFQINTSQQRYQTFVEETGPSNKQVVETVTFPNKVIFSNVVIGGQSVGALEVRFFPPFGEIRMTGGTYNESKNVVATVTVQFQGTSRTRTITIDGISGRIQVQ